MRQRLKLAAQRRLRKTMPKKRRRKKMRLENLNPLLDQPHLRLSPSFESGDWAARQRISRRAGMTKSRGISRNRVHQRREDGGEVALDVVVAAGHGEEVLRMLLSSQLTRKEI
jgi:hypothetical protein